MRQRWLGPALGMLRLKSPGSVLALGLAEAFVIAAAYFERQSTSVGAADRALSGATFGVALPVLSLLALERVCDSQRVDHSLEVLARFGVSRRNLALGLLLSVGAVLAGVGAALGISSVIAARSFSDPDLWQDMLATGRIGLVGGAAYAGWFGLASMVGRGGAMRFGAFLLDWALGQWRISGSLPCPRSQIRNLLGAPPFEAGSPWLSVAILLALWLACSLLVAWRRPA